MKNFLLLLLLVGASLFPCLPALALVPEFTAYMRAGTGSNGKDGAQECVANKGSSGNEFRLGNECGIYSEFSFGGYVLKPENESAPFWALHSTFAFITDNKEDFELNSNTTWIPRELYVEGGRVDGHDFYVWMGKRFYRWAAIDMDDFFSVDMSGPGFGVVGGKTNYGVWSGAVIHNTGSREMNVGDPVIVTENGRAAKTTLHLRLDDMETALGTWSYWLSAGRTAHTKSAAGVEYKSNTGGLFAVKNAHTLFGGKNELGAMVGNSAMSNFSPAGELVRDCTTANVSACNVGSSFRYRVWDGLSWEFGSWTGQVGLIHEDWNRGQDNHLRWTSLGIRPIYWFSEHLSLMAEAGTSTVTDDSDTFGARRMTRMTIAPQMSFGKGNFSRPVFRAFYSRTNWSDNNLTSVAKTSYARVFEKDSFGVQTEIWF